MYDRFYGLSRKPFRLSPDPSFFFKGHSHGRAYAYLRYGLHMGEGFVVITGPVGAGKTTIARALLSSLNPERTRAVQIVSTFLAPDELLRMIAQEFGIETRGLAKAELLHALEDHFRAAQRQGRQVLVIIDEAQNLSPESLEELRMLANLQHEGRALLQVFLLGQEEFHETLRLPHMEHLRQRIIASYHLVPLDEAETRAYIEHRLRLAGWEDDPRIDDAAYALIHAYTGGIPRKINVFCDRLFLHACLEEKHEIDEETVQTIIREKDSEFDFRPVDGPGAPDRSPAPDNLHALQGGGSRLDALEARLDALEARLERDRERLRLVLELLAAGEEADLRALLDQVRSRSAS
ncbi:MAG: AAA family ATPase [Gammaproteobacteria bacterium]|nr:MAG: AAA family ATPase [Gammaproteobacteria bacterium]